jgi:ABC-2 type transport system ATP-binding protein
VERGQLFGLLGLNGAGKTTLLRILATVLSPDRGTASVGGVDVVREPRRVRSLVGFCNPDSQGLYLRLTGRENLGFFAALQRVPSDVAGRRISALLGFFSLESAAGRLVKDYSTGMRAKLRLARALLHDPELLLLDEPTSGMDFQSACEVYDLLRAINAEFQKTVVFTTHHLKEAEDLCPTVAIIHEGQIRAQAAVSELKRKLERPGVVVVRLRKGDDSLVPRLTGLAGVKGLIEEQAAAAVGTGEVERLKLHVTSPDDVIAAIVATVPAADLVSVGVEEPTLEDIFIAETRKVGEAS